MKEIIFLYSDHAEPPYIPNQYSLAALLGARVLRMARGKRRYEHEFEKEVGPNFIATFRHIQTIDLEEGNHDDHV